MDFNFVNYEPTLQNYWRAIILFGRNTASYKFALAKSLIDVSVNRQSDLIPLDELALPYALHLCEHLKNSPKQSTSKSSKFLRACQDYNKQNITQDQLIDITKKEGFKYVLDAFHVVNTKTIQQRFYDVLDETFFIDERKYNKGIRLKKNLFELFYTYNETAESLKHETESRWNLVEKAWELNIGKNLIQVEFDPQTQLLFTNNQDDILKRTPITSSRSALNGYQKSRCFYCFKEISIADRSSTLADVDHFFPHSLKPQVANAGCASSVNVDGVWNLVLACQDCNRGEKGKFAQIPSIPLLERLHTRNEYLIDSHHPLRETLILQTGRTLKERQHFLNKSYRFSKEYLLHEWQPEQQGIMHF